MTDLLTQLPSVAPQLIAKYGLPADPDLYSVAFVAAVESIRGTHAATLDNKKRFIEAILSYMRREGSVESWEFVGSGGRQDYRVRLSEGTDVAIEAKGCPDGNNMTIWERPAWAHEFIVWSQCPESLRSDPGRGAWSGINSRLVPKSVVEGVVIDAMLFWDARCGTALRPCPKSYGLRPRRKAAAVKGQDADWIPPPCIFLFPRTVARAPGNPNPAPHTWRTCRFADALLTAFKVPNAEKDAYVHSAHVEVTLRPQGRYLRVGIDVGQPGFHDRIEGSWRRLRRE